MECNLNITLYLFRRLKSQIAKLQEESRLQQKLNPRISLSENEKFARNETKTNPNHVYKYFSKSSPRIDSALFGYRRYFDDLQIDDKEKANHCLRCHKSLEKLCRDCDDDERISTMTTMKSIDDESFKSAKSQPFSFNYETNSIFNHDENILRNYLKTYNQMTNYQKLYGDLRNRKVRKEVEDKKEEILKLDPIDDLLNNAQYAVITGYATSVLKSQDEAPK